MKLISLLLLVFSLSQIAHANSCNPYPGAENKGDPCFKKATEISRCAYRVKLAFDNQEPFCCQQVESATKTIFNVTQAIYPANDITQLVYSVELNDNGNDCFITNMTVINEK